MDLISVYLLTIAVVIKMALAQHTINTQRTLVWVISLDGFRHDFINPSITPNLARFRDEGSYAEHMRSVFPTLTFVNHHSIATGRYVENHGVMGNVLYDPQFGRLKDTESQYKYNKYIVPIYTLNEINGGFSGSMMWPGGGFSYFNPNPNAQSPEKSCTHIKDFSDEIPWNQRVGEVINWFKNETHPANFVMTYINEPDGESHTYGPNSPEHTNRLRTVDNLAGYIEDRLKEADLYDHVNVVYVSDHGMDQVTAEQFLTPGTYLLYGSSPFLQVVPSAGSYIDVLGKLREAAILTGNFQVFTCESFPAYWRVCYRSEARNFQSRFGCLFVLANPGFGFEQLADLAGMFEQKLGKPFQLSSVYGSHGYDNNWDKMYAIFMARGPHISKGVKVPAINNVDLYNFFCRLLSIRCYQNDGQDRVDIFNQILDFPLY